MKNELLMHIVSGDVSTREEWKADFDSMSIEDWFGFPAEECEGLEWDDAEFLEVVTFEGKDDDWEAGETSYRFETGPIDFSVTESGEGGLRSDWSLSEESMKKLVALANAE